MMKILHAPYPDDFKSGASLEMLHDLYHENPDHPQVWEAQTVLKNALSQWDDQEVADFLQNHLLQPPHSTDLQEKTAEERRRFLRRIYNYLFDQLRNKEGA